MKSLIVVLMFLFLGMTTTSHAGFEPKTYSFSPTIGFYDFDSHQELKTGVLMGLRVSRYLTSQVAVEAVALLISAEAETSEDRNVGGLLYQIDGLYHFSIGDKWRPFLAVGFGGITVKENVTGNNNNLGLNYGGGIKYLFSDQVAFRADIRQVLVNDSSHIEHDMLYTVGLEVAWEGRPRRARVSAMTRTDANIAPAKETKPAIEKTMPEKAIVDLPLAPAALLTMKSTESDTTIVSAGGIAVADSDKDGIPDSHDLCANTAPGVGVDQDGCATDSDSDGVSDHLDKCAATPAGLMTDKNGCTLDTDLDTVPDSRDFCANTPKGVAVNAKGCPPPQDSDGDKVFDDEDKCPATPTGIAVGENGCALDQDGDGVLEALDWCPGTPGDVAVDHNGCQVLIAIKQKTAAELHIRFENGKAELSSAFTNEVAQIADHLKKFPDTMIEIEGHSDNTGPKKLNDHLSLKRAESLKAALTGRFGIKASRMTTKAYGFARPIADNKTAEGRKKNRRVVVILSQP